MRKLRKNHLSVENSVEAYGCSCICSCWCLLDINRHHDWNNPGNRNQNTSMRTGVPM